VSNDPAISAALSVREGGERELADLSARFAELTPDLLSIVGFDGLVKWVNPAYERLLGYAPEELIGKPCLDVVHPDDTNRALKEGERLARAADVSLNYEVRIRGKDGSYGWYLFTTKPVPHEELVFLIGRDVTERKAAEEAHREAQELFRRAFDDAPIGMALLSLERERTGRFLRVNRALCDITGYEDAELIGADFEAIEHPEDSQHDTHYLPWVLAGETTQYEVEKRFVRADGSSLWALLSASLVKDLDGLPLYLIAQLQDITERKETEQALWESREQLQATIDNAPAAIYLKDHDGRFLLINRRFEMLVDVDREEVIGKTDRDLFSPDIAEAIQASDRDVLTTGFPLQVEELAQHDDGAHTYVAIKFPLLDSDGVPYGVGSISTDITERKRAEDALRQSEERFREIINSANEAFISIDSSGLITAWNPAAEATFGWPLEDVVGRDLPSVIIPPRMREAHARGLQEFFATGKGPILDQRVELEALHRDGHEFAVELTVSAMRVGEEYVFNAFLHDISDRRNAAAELHASMERIQDLYNNAPCGYHSLDSDGMFVGVNDTELSWLGYTRDEVVGKLRFSDLISEESRPTFEDAFSRLKRQGAIRDVEFEMLRKDGSTFPASVSATAIKDTDGSFLLSRSTLFDITERRWAERLFNTQHEVTLILAQSRTLDEVLPALLETVAGNLGWQFAAYWESRDQDEQLRCRATWQHASEDAPDFAPLTHAKVFGPGEGLVGETWTSGETRWSHDVLDDDRFVRSREASAAGLHGALCMPINGDDRVIGVIELFTDELRQPDQDLLEMMATIGRQVGQFIERKRAEQALRDIEEGFRRAFDDAPIGMALLSLTPGGRFLQVNQALSDLTGYSEGELMSISLRSLTHRDDREAERPLLESLLADEIPNYQREQRYVRADGRIVWVMLNASTVHNREGKLLYAIAQIQDITERKRAEQELADAATELERRAGELERSNADLQQFAYVASHDLSEPLRMVSSYVQLLARRYGGQLGPDADDFIGFAVDGAQRMQALIDGLLMYSRAGTSEYAFAPVDCSALVQQVLTTLHHAIIGAEAEVTVDPLPTILGDPTQLSQLFQNLISNGIKFVEEGSPHVHVSAERIDGAWAFSIADNGIGIEPRHAERIFNVFQRLHSREEYAGSGVGLAICKRIVERHGGTIWVEPSPEGGSKFSFTIPDREPQSDISNGDGKSSSLSEIPPQ
jgi:PAS domain S-box-containing protein